MSILISIRPLIFISKLAGLSLFTINSKTCQAAVTRLDLFAIFVTIFMHLFFNFVYWRSVLGPDIDDITNEILEVSTPLLLYVDYLINAFAIFWFFLKRRKIVELILRFAEIDENLAMEFGIKFNYKRQRNKIAVLLLATMMVATLININDFITSAGIKINSLEFYNFDIIFFLWNSLCQIIQFCCFVVGMRAIRQRFKLVGHCVNDRLNAIKILNKIHLKIAKIVQDFNEIFTPIMFMHFADIFCWLCFLIFDIVTYPWKNFFETLAMNIPHSVYMISFIIATIKTAESVKSEAKKCVAKLHDVSGEVKDKNEIFQFLIQLITMPVKFTCGLIDFDWKMLFKFISASFMYFIILMQINKSFIEK
ncbi:hypothetical protein PVAND_016970 [Polypedilum vanderplanki]|nr:hypothetical protein PVAND_016970 [Polypedilum vanderplanki]